MQFLWVLITVSILGTAASHEMEKRGAAKSRDAGERRIVCYYTNWSVYRKGLAKYTPQNINPYMCTHLVYAFGGLTDEFEVTTFDSYQDIEQGGYAQFNGLKQYNKAMKTLLAIGGWNEGSARFSELVSAPEYRENFTLSVIKHLRRYNFDGLDLDWEYPGSRDGSAPEDKRNYAVLVKELREAFELEASKSSKKRLLLTMAVPAGQNYIDKGYEVPTLNKYLDFFNLLTYDYHSVYEPTVNHHAALLPAPGTSEYEVNYQLNIDWTIRYYLKKGASKDKLVMGIPTYGRSYTLLDGDYFTLGSSADGPGNKGNYTNEKGYLSFYEVCEAVSADGWEVRKPYPKRVGPFAFKGNQWVGYDDENFVIRKAEYVRDNGLGGVMFWTVDSDDFRGLCNGERYPLIEAAKKALLTPLPTDQNEARALDGSSRKSSSLNSLRSSKRTTTPATTTKPSRRRRPPGNRRGPNAQSSATIDPLNTPEPPTTPSSVKGFDCKREGFYPNPDDCKKYYWCLSSGTSGLGIVAHAFTCPSDLIFNKQIDGCDHPDRVKCKVTPSRGKAKEAGPPTTPIPTTTEFEYLLEDYDYYYYDFIGGDQEPLVEPLQEITLQKEDGASSAPSSPSRNSGGNQFQVSKKTPTQEEEEEVRSPSSRATAAPPPARSSNRARPQYASIQRDRSRRPTPSPRQEQGEPSVAQNERQPSRPSRPQYVTLERERPAAVDPVNARQGTNAIPAEPQGTSSTTPSGLGLSYVTLSRRRRPTTPIPEVVQQESTPSGGLEYVTLRRSRPLATTEAPADDYYEYYSYDDLADALGQEEQTTTSTTSTTTTTTTTTTTPKPRIRIPPSLRSPRPSPRPRPRPRPRPSSRTRTRARPSLPETFRSSSQRTRGRPTAEAKEAEQPEEEVKPAEPSTTAPVVEPATPKPESVEPQTAVESREGETVLAEAGEPKSSDVESLIEETLQLFQQSDQELATESSPKHSPDGSSSTTEPPSSPSAKVVTEPTERSDTTVIPVSPTTRQPLLVRPFNHSVTSMSPMESNATLLHAEEQHITTTTITTTTSIPGNRIPQDLIQFPSRASSNRPTVHSPNSTDDTPNNSTQTKQIPGIKPKDIYTNLKSVYYDINNQTLKLKSTVDNIRITDEVLDEASYVYSKLAEIDTNLDLVSNVLQDLNIDKVDVNTGNTIVETQSSDAVVPLNDSPYLNSENGSLLNLDSDGEGILCLDNICNETDGSVGGVDESSVTTEYSELLTTKIPEVAEDVLGVTKEGDKFRLRKIKTRVVASPVKVVIGDLVLEYPLEYFNDSQRLDSSINDFESSIQEHLSSEDSKGYDKKIVEAPLSNNLDTSSIRGDKPRVTASPNLERNLNSGFGHSSRDETDFIANVSLHDQQLYSVHASNRKQDPVETTALLDYDDFLIQDNEIPVSNGHKSTISEDERLSIGNISRVSPERLLVNEIETDNELNKLSNKLNQTKVKSHNTSDELKGSNAGGNRSKQLTAESTDNLATSPETQSKETGILTSTEPDIQDTTDVNPSTESNLHNSIFPYSNNITDSGNNTYVLQESSFEELYVTRNAITPTPKSIDNADLNVLLIDENLKKFASPTKEVHDDRVTHPIEPISLDEINREATTVQPLLPPLFGNSDKEHFKGNLDTYYKIFNSYDYNPYYDYVYEDYDYLADNTLNYNNLTFDDRSNKLFNVLSTGNRSLSRQNGSDKPFVTHASSTPQHTSTSLDLTQVSSTSNGDEESPRTTISSPLHGDSTAVNHLHVDRKRLSGDVEDVLHDGVSGVKSLSPPTNVSQDDALLLHEKVHPPVGQGKEEVAAETDVSYDDPSLPQSVLTTDYDYYQTTDLPLEYVTESNDYENDGSTAFRDETNNSTSQTSELQTRDHEEEERADPHKKFQPRKTKQRKGKGRLVLKRKPVGGTNTSVNIFTFPFVYGDGFVTLQN